METQRKYCPVGLPLAKRHEATFGVPDPDSPLVTNSEGERLLLTTRGGAGVIVDYDGFCAFKNVGEKLNFAETDVGGCSFCGAKCTARRVRSLG